MRRNVRDRDETEPGTVAVMVNDIIVSHWGRKDHGKEKQPFELVCS